MTPPWPVVLAAVILGLPFAVLIACIIGILFVKLLIWWDER